MFLGLGCVSRLAMMAIIVFTVGSVALAGLILVTDGFSGTSVVDLPTVRDKFLNREGPAPADNPEDTAPGKLNDVVEKRELFEDVPYIDEVSTDSEVVGTNIGLAIFFAIVFGALGTMLNNLVKEHEKELEDWLEYFYVRRVFRFFQMAIGQNVRRGCLGLPIIIAIFAMYGVIFSFLEPGTSLFSPQGIQLAIVMSMSVGVVSLAGDIAQRQVARIWNKSTRFGIYPANLSIALLTTALSRFIGFTPGIMFGTPGGVDIDMDDETQFREVVLAIVTLIVIIFFGVSGWLLTAAIRSQGDVVLSGSRLEFIAPLAQLGVAIGFALFVVAIETAFFEMVPFSLTMGSQMFRWNPLIWIATFIPIFFVFSHTLLNPNGEYLDPFSKTPTLLLTGVTVIMFAILIWFWALFRFFEPPHVAAQRRREAYAAQQQAMSQQAPYQGYGYPQQPQPPQQPSGYNYPPQQNPPGYGAPPQQPPRRDDHPPRPPDQRR